MLLLEDAASDEFVSVVGVKQTDSKSIAEPLTSAEATRSPWAAKEVSIMDAGTEYGILRALSIARKITVEIPVELLEKA